MTRKSPDSLIWIDLEMTGLNPDNDQIIEVAVAITDHHLSEIVEGPNLVIGQPEKLMESMDSWNTKQHKKSGLYKRGILPGDVVLINTGWSDNYQDPDEKGIYYSSAPGISYQTAKFLGSKKVVGVGLDTPFVDAVGNPNSEIQFEVPKGTPTNLGFPVHHYFLTQAGVHTLENLKLKGLVKDEVEVSCVMILPLLSKGSAASPIRPVAIGVSK